MGRPRKYHTPEEKRAADTAKAMRYHMKNRKKINSKRRKARARARDSKGTENTLEKSTSQSSPRKDAPRRPTQLELLRDHVQSIKARFARALGNQSDVEYLTGLCTSFKALYQKDYSRVAGIFEEAGDVLEKLRADLLKYGDQILNIAGYNNDYTVYEEIRNHISSLISQLAHLNGEAFTPDTLVDDFQSSRLFFQQ